MTVTNKPDHREITKETVKTIARGMPGVSGVTVVTNARVTYTTRAAAGASAPGIPCAL
jgi:phosphoribosylanthranilate isomerase